MELFYSSGLRLSELAQLQWHQVDFSSGLVTVTGNLRAAFGARTDAAGSWLASPSFICQR